MTSTIITKNSSTASSVPSSGSLTQGELAVNVTDKKLYTKDSGGTVVKLVGSLGNQEASAAAITGGSINGTTVGASTASTGAFTTLSASSTVSGTGFSTYLASPPAIGGTAAAAGSFTTLSASGNVTLSGGTANGVAYLNGSKVVTSGSALTFDGTTLGLSSGSAGTLLNLTDAVAQTFRVSTTSTTVNLDSVSGGSLAFLLGGSEQMRLTSTGLGIGTSSPSYKLQVASGSTANNAYFSSTATTAYTPTAYNGDKARLFLAGGNGTGATNGIEFTGGGSNENYFGVVQESGGSGAFVFQTYNGSAYGERLRLDSSGNLGLGVTPSAFTFGKALQINGAAFSGDATTWRTRVTTNAYNDGNWRYLQNNYAQMYLQNSSSGDHSWHTAASGTAGNAITFTQAMTLDASGNLGIGTTSPSNRLHVAISSGPYVARFQNTSTATDQYNSILIYQGASGSATGYIGTGGSTVGNTAFANNFVVGTQTSSPLVFTTNDTERARIDSSGNLLVGTTSSLGSYKFQINGDFSGAYGQTVTSTASSGYFINFATSSGQCGYITGSGTSTSYVTSSDYRLKNTIAPMTGALAKVALLKPCTYKWNADGSSSQGFIAHELAEVVPECVVGAKDAVDAEGNPKYQGIDTSFLVATLTAAIQELKAEFDAYKASHP